MAKAASGGGSIRKKVITKKGKKYIYWEGRYCAGNDPGTGKPIRHSITAKTQEECRKLLAAAVDAIDKGVYREP